MITMLAAAGIVAPILFTALVVAQGALYPDYSHVAQPISALSEWPHGWVQNLNFIATGVLMSAYAAGLHLGVGPGYGGVVGPALVFLSGVGLAIAGVFPWKPPDQALAAFLGHSVGTFLSFMGAAFGLIVLSWRMEADPAWRDLASFAHGSGVAVRSRLASPCTGHGRCASGFGDVFILHKERRAQWRKTSRVGCGA